MQVAAGKADRGQIAAIAIVLFALAVLTISAAGGYPLKSTSAVLALTVAIAAAYRFALAWRNLLALLVLIVLFIPIRRYALPGNLPFQLEPYRLFVAFLLLAWATSLLIDRRVRLRRSGFEAPFLLVVAGALVSDIANPGRFGAESTYAVKQLSFFLSFIVVFYVVVTLVRTFDDLSYLVVMLVGGGTIVGGSAIIESRTHFNVFNHLHTAMPFLRPVPDLLETSDARGFRVVASAQHPIALGAALVLLVPLAVYLAQTTRQRRWTLSAVVLAIAALATVSRTAVLMLFAVALVFLLLRPVETKRLWPFLLPALLAAHIAAPGTLGTIKNSFFPKGGLIAEQNYGKGTNVRGRGRIADLGPSLQEWKQRPLFGEGFGTRISSGPDANAPILDDQWLGTLLEVGAFGFCAFIWLFVRPLRRLFREAKRDTSERGWLLTALAASVAAFATGMLTYDALAFIQVTFLLFIMLALAASALALPRNQAAR